jgi:hypothetical protein
MTEDFMGAPTEEMLRSAPHLKRSEEFVQGRISACLELVTVIRSLEAAVGTSLLALNREEIISTLATVVQRLWTYEEACAYYDSLCERRRQRTISRVRALSGDLNADRNVRPSVDGDPEATRAQDRPALGSPVPRRILDPSPESFEPPS